MTPVEAIVMITGLVADLVGPAAPAFLRALAAGAVQAAAEGTAGAAGMAAQAAARPEAVLRGLRFLSGAYTVVWVILAAYLVMLSLRQHRLARQVRRLRERLGA